MVRTSDLVKWQITYIDISYSVVILQIYISSISGEPQMIFFINIFIYLLILKTIHFDNLSALKYADIRFYLILTEN